MNAKEYFQTRIKKAKDFGFPDPIFLNTETLTDRTRKLYTVEIQSIHIPDKVKKKTHHFSLKFSKFSKIDEEPYWEEEDLTNGFSIADKSSIEKLAAYIKVNQALLDIDILSKDYTSVFLSSDQATTKVLQQILSSSKNKDIIFKLFAEHYPELDDKILTYKIIKRRREKLKEFRTAVNDNSKLERNYWQKELENNRWMFGLSYIVPLEEKRIDIKNTADYLFKSDDGFIDIVEIKHPHIDFWQKDKNDNYVKYREYLQPSEELKGSITQSTNYIFQVEKRFSDPDWQEANKCDAPVKPTCQIVAGRSIDWKNEEYTAFRLLNDSLHGTKIITFDQLIDRAERLLKLSEEDTK